MEFVLFEGSLITFTVLKILYSFSIKHSIMPISLVLSMSTLTIQNPPPTLYSISKLPLIPTSITPPEGSLSISLTSLELTFINIALFTSPVIYSAALFFIKSKLSKIIVSCGKIQLSLPLKLPIVKISIDDFMCAFKKANTFSMRSINLCLSNINNFWVLKKFRIVKGWLNSQYNWSTCFDCQQLFQSKFNIPQLSAYKSSFIIQIIQIKLSFLQHFFL